MIQTRISAILIAATLTASAFLAFPGQAFAAALSTPKVFATNDEVSASSTTYIFSFKTASAGSIKRVEVTAPSGYGVGGATFTGSSILLQLGTLSVSGQTMRLTLPVAIPVPVGTQLTLQVSGINNPSSVGPHTFDFATKNNAGTTIDSGSASITLTDSSVGPSSIGTDQIQDGAITFDKLAADVLSYITGLIDNLRVELLALIDAEAAARMAADTQLQSSIDAEAAARAQGDINTLSSAMQYTDSSVTNEAAARAAADQTLQSNIDSEAAARAAADANLQDQIDDLTARVEALEGDEPEPTTISIADFASTEGDAGTKNFQFLVLRSGDLSGTSTVDYGTADGTVEAGSPPPATEPSDYAADTDTLTFLSGDDSILVSIQVVGDMLLESNERFFVNLSNCVGCTITDAQAEGIIQNDE